MPGTISMIGDTTLAMADSVMHITVEGKESSNKQKRFLRPSTAHGNATVTTDTRANSRGNTTMTHNQNDYESSKATVKKQRPQTAAATRVNGLNAN